MPEVTDEQVKFYVGLDLAPSGLFTGLAVLEKRYRHRDFGRHYDVRYAVRHLARFPPGTPYADILAAVGNVLAGPLRDDTTLVIDQTAVGRAVVDTFSYDALGHSPRRLSLTAGHMAQLDEQGGWLVPKKDLVGCLQVLLQEKRLTVARSLEHAATLAGELQHFQLKAVPLKPDALEWRERPHDDLVLAVAIAVWEAERFFPCLAVFF
jgi:hypothetical protein